MPGQYVIHTVIFPVSKFGSGNYAKILKFRSCDLSEMECNNAGILKG